MQGQSLEDRKKSEDSSSHWEDPHRGPISQRLIASGGKEEKLKPLPEIPYPPYRVISASISKTAFVEFETNRYSVPSTYSEIRCEILAYPDPLEILIKGKRVASHQRSFGRRQKMEEPAHRERLLDVDCLV